MPNGSLAMFTHISMVKAFAPKAVAGTSAAVANAASLSRMLPVAAVHGVDGVGDAHTDADANGERERVPDADLLGVGSADGEARQMLRITLFSRSATTSAPLGASAIKRGVLNAASVPAPSALPAAVLFDPARSVTVLVAMDISRITLLDASET